MKIGTVVQLKSGSPEMTVKKYPKNPISNKIDKTQVECIWFNNDLEQSGTFPVETLEIVENIDSDLAEI